MLEVLIWQQAMYNMHCQVGEDHPHTPLGECQYPPPPSQGISCCSEAVDSGLHERNAEQCNN